MPDKTALSDLLYGLYKGTSQKNAPKERSGIIMIFTVEGQWEIFRKNVHPDAPLNSLEMEVIKGTWFAAYFDCLTLILELGDDKYTEDQAGRVLSALTNESGKWLKEHIEKLLADEAAQGHH
jgi:hypothetical protein